MIELRNETLLTLGSAASLLPRDRRGRPVSQSTVFRWITVGVQGPAGLKVRLDAVKLGGRWLTSVEALERFALRQTPTLEVTVN